MTIQTAFQWHAWGEKGGSVVPQNNTSPEGITSSKVAIQRAFALHQ